MILKCLIKIFCEVVRARGRRASQAPKGAGLRPSTLLPDRLAPYPSLPVNAGGTSCQGPQSGLSVPSGSDFRLKKIFDSQKELENEISHYQQVAKKIRHVVSQVPWVVSELLWIFLLEEKKRGLIGCTSGRHLEFFLFGASPSNFVEESGYYTSPEELTC